MADPLSIVANSAGVIDLSIRVVKFIQRTKKGTETIDEDLRQLIGDIENLRHTSGLIQDAFAEDIKRSEKANGRDDDTTAGIWRATAAALKDCKAALKMLDSGLDHVQGDKGSSVFDKLKRHFRMLSMDEEFEQLRLRLDKGHQILSMALISLSIITARQAQVGNSKSFAKMTDEVAQSKSKLDQIIRSLESTPGDAFRLPYEYQKDGIENAKSVTKLAWLNVHFMVPQPVSNMFIGREPDLAAMRYELEKSKHERGTKRVVIFGLGGSGKTQFCCKFAQDNRPSFWGVFFIDATNAETIQSSYADIAARAKIEPKESNVKHWLSEQAKPWLLIVDNADDHLRTHHPQDFIPDSENGFVIFTTRNQLLRTLGHVAIKFEGLEAEGSSKLLLSAAGKDKPFAPKMIETAKDICRKFGFLPLAILHAGKAILRGTCTFENCLDYVEESLTRVQRIINDGKANSIFSPISEVSNPADDPARTINETVYATFELVIPAAREEAAQLLRLFSFMHSQRFHFHILLEAILNPQRQDLADKRAAKHAGFFGIQWQSSNGVMFQIIRKMVRLLEGLGDRPALPMVLRSLRNADRKEAEFKLRGVLAELRALALIDYIEADDTYCMHSSVNWWVRASMEYQEKAVWCQAACNVLTAAILLPPVGIQDSDAQLRRQALPHVEYVRKKAERLRIQLIRRQEKRERSWPSVEPTLSRARLLQDAKFSLVYADCGKFAEARELISGVDKVLAEALGLHDPIALRARLFLSDTNWWLGNLAESIRLQEELLAACTSSLGDSHVDTLRVFDRLAMSFWQNGQYHKAREYSEKALKGFQKAYPRGHVDKFQAMTNFGQCIGKLADFDGAVEVHSKALDGLVEAEKAMSSEFGEQILDVQHNLAMARHDRYWYASRQAEDLHEALQLQTIVLEQRQAKLGKQHPKSLWALCSLARITASTGELEKAEEMFKWGIPVAERTLSANHLGILMGKTYLGQVLTRAGKLDEAEKLLRSVVAIHRTRDRKIMHGDELAAATILLDCYRRQEKTQVAEEMEKEVLKGIRNVFGEDSPWESHFVGTYTAEVFVADPQSPETAHGLESM